MRAPELTAFDVWLMRHGESAWNAQGLAQGQAKAPGLTAGGRDQSRAAAEQLADLGISMVISSDLLRATETAEIVAARLDARLWLEPRLRERALGAAEGWPARELAGPLGGGGVAEGRIVDPDAHPRGGESIRRVVARVGAYLDELAALASAERVLLVTHGGVVRAAAAAVGRARLEGMPWPPVRNAEVDALRVTVPR